MVTKPSHEPITRAAADAAPAAGALGLADSVLAAMAEERDRWILWVPIGLIVGIAAYFTLPAEPPATVTALAAAGGGAALILVHGPRRAAVAAGLIPLAGFALAQLRAELVAAPVLATEMRAVGVEGVVHLVEPQDGEAVRLVIAEPQIEGLTPPRTPERLRVTVRTEADGILPGDRVRLRATLEPPPGPVAPHAFDFARKAYFERLGAVGYALSPVERLEAGRFSSLWRAIHARRLMVAERVRSIVPGAAGALSAALLTGLRGAIPDSDAEAMRTAGLAHLLAISGLHIGLVTAAAFFLVRAALAAIGPLARRVDVKPAATLAAWAVAMGYLLLAGATLPTQRAVLMVSLMLLAVLFGREPISLRLVALAAVAILLLAPEAALSASFQMSFAAVVALVIVYHRAAPRFAEWRRQAAWPRRLALYFLGVLLTTLVAEAAIAAFAAFHFNRITVYGLLANLVAVPVMAFWVMPAGLLALIAMSFGLDAPMLTVMGWGSEIILETARDVAALPGAVRPIPTFPGPVLFLGALGLLWLLLWRTPLIKLFAAGPLAAASVIAALSRPPDILMSREADLFAVNTPEGLFVSSMRAARYDREQWARLSGHLEARSWEHPDAPVRCDDLGCRIDLGRLGGAGSVAVALTPEALIADCRAAEMLLAAVPVRRACERPEPVIDRFDVWRRGAHAIRIARDGVQVTDTTRSRGARPWVRQRGNEDQS